MQDTLDKIKRPTLQDLDAVSNKMEASTHLLEVIKRKDEIYERSCQRKNEMCGIIGSYKALLRAAIEVAKGESMAGIEYIENKEIEMIERVDALFK